MYNNKLLNKVILIIIGFSCMFSLGYFYLNSENIIHSHRYIIFFPLVYVISYYLFIHKTIEKYGISIFLAVYIVISFFRYIVLSILVVETGWFFGRSSQPPSPESFETAILLMLYELVMYSIAIFIFHKKLIKPINQTNIDVKLPKQSIIYIAFLLIVIILTVLRPSALNFFSFFTVNENIIDVADVSFLTGSISILLNIAKLTSVFLIISYTLKIFGSKSPNISFLLISTFITLNIFIYFGANRSDFIFNAVASIILLIYLYKKAGIVLSTLLGLVIPIIITSITSHRQSVTITGGENRLIDMTDTLQIYLAGIYNVAIGVEISKIYENINPLFSLLDIFRSAIGPNILLSNLDIVRSSVIYNERIFNSGLVSQIIPMISQGQFYFGFIFSPLIGVIFIFIAIYFTKTLLASKRIELIFLLTLFSGRLGFVMAQNGNILINELTFFLPIFLIVYFLNNKITYGEKL